MTINDAMTEALAANGFDSLYDWLLTFAASDAKQINDLWRDALIELTGLPAENYQYNDYLSSYLSGRGYVGSISDGLLNFWTDIAGGVIPLPSGTTPLDADFSTNNDWANNGDFA